MDHFQTNVCHPYGAGNIAPSGFALTYTGNNNLASSTSGSTPQAQAAGQNGPMYPEGLMFTEGTKMITYAYTSPGTWSSTTTGGITTWSYTASTLTTTNVYVINYGTVNCAGLLSTLVVRPELFNLVGNTAPSCIIKSYIGSQSQWTPLSLTYNVYASGSSAPVQSYTQSTNSFTIAFSTSVSITSPGTGSSTPFTLTANPTTQVQKFYYTQNDCMSGNTANLGWTQYTNIANGAVSVSTPACIGNTAFGGNLARNLANLNMCSVPTISTAISPSVNYLMVQQFETSTCTGSLGYYYIQLNVCHFVSEVNTISVMYTLQAQQSSSTTTNYNIIQQYYLWTATGSPTTPTCSGSSATLQGSSIYGTTGTSTAATTTTPIVATTGSCMPSGTSYATFSITAQPAAVTSAVTPSYSTASYATAAACTTAYSATTPTTIGTSNLVQLYVPSSTCNVVNYQRSYQSTTASSMSPMVPSINLPGALYANNILTLDSATDGSSTSTSISVGQITNTGVPSPLSFYSQVSMVGCTNNAATATTSTCFTISQVYTGLTVANAQSTIFLTYLKGAVQYMLLDFLSNSYNPTITYGTYTDVIFISATAVSGSTNQVTVVFNVQLPSAIYGSVLSTTAPFSNNPFSLSNASPLMQTYYNTLVSTSNIINSFNLGSGIAIASTAVIGVGCTSTTITVTLPGSVTTLRGNATVTSNNPPGFNPGTTACFADSEVVTMENGMTKSIAEVQIGDRILSADVQGKTSFSDVVYIPHSANDIEATFIMLTTETGRNVKMTTNHILPAGQCGATMTVRRADAVSAGDCVMTVDGVEKVMDMVTMQGKGIYTVVTNKEYIVVNGIVATPFGGVNPTLANMYYNLHRLVYAFMPAALMSSHSIMQKAMDTFASLLL